MKVIKYTDFYIDNVRLSDYPDFVDAHITEATAVLEDGSAREATEDELEELNKDRSLIHDLAMDKVSAMGE